MAKSLDNFIVEAKATIDDFEKWWRIQNAKNSDEFPMELPDENEGLWWEFLQGHDIGDE